MNSEGIQGRRAEDYVGSLKPHEQGLTAKGVGCNPSLKGLTLAGLKEVL